jgi:hypothetical protein
MSSSVPSIVPRLPKSKGPIQTIPIVRPSDVLGNATENDRHEISAKLWMAKSPREVGDRAGRLDKYQRFQACCNRTAREWDKLGLGKLGHMVPDFSDPGLVTRYQAEVLQPVEGRSSDSFPAFRGVPTFHVEVGPLFAFRRSGESHIPSRQDRKVSHRVTPHRRQKNIHSGACPIHHSSSSPKNI